MDLHIYTLVAWYESGCKPVRGCGALQLVMHTVQQPSEDKSEAATCDFTPFTAAPLAAN